ncbi:helix-turn-helix domain-containing protein [Paenibacillus gorillae]|uniref:helix-turn-helix domain-containing protein n=1 Tax=Paenibacillus gorillae TaxID=1243662 RepID=UPI0004B9C865|nr:helix-turn-helix transcriptional regulator [Paenibacillus gorillae]
MDLYHHIFLILDRPMAIIRNLHNTASLVEANDAFSRLMGCSIEELKGRCACSIIEQYSVQAAARPYQRETYLCTGKRSMPIRMDHTPLPYINEETGNLSLIQVEDLSALRWIEEQFEHNKVLISGIVDSTYHIRILRDFYAPLLLKPEQTLEDENFLQFISEQEFERIQKALETAGKLKKANNIKVKTNKLGGVEFELSITFTPIYDGFGSVREYAFVIWDLKPVSEGIDSSMRLKIWMAKRDMSAIQLSAATHISLQTISKLRNGKIEKPQRLTAELIASELKVDVAEIWPEVRRGR